VEGVENEAPQTKSGWMKEKRRLVAGAGGEMKRLKQIVALCYRGEGRHFGVGNNEER